MRCKKENYTPLSERIQQSDSLCVPDRTLKVESAELTRDALEVYKGDFSALRPGGVKFA